MTLRTFRFAFVSLVACLGLQRSVISQDVSDPGAYISYINDKERETVKKYLSYISAASHGKSLRKVEKLREQVLNSIYETRIDISGVPPFKGDKTLRDASVAYLLLCYKVFNEDYSKIVNMEEIAEQSYDKMEAYLLAQQIAGEKLQEAADKRRETAKQFASKFNVNLIEATDELDKKMEQSARLNEYYNKIYLIFFRCHKQEAYLVEAMNANNIISIEQNKNSLLNFANQGLATLDTLKAFDSDASLITAAQKALRFFKWEAEEQVGIMTDYLLKKENFEKMQKAFNSKSSGQRTEPEINSYNKSVNEINKASKELNRMNNESNSRRAAVIDQWNDSVKKFLDNHMPYAK